MIKAEYSEMSAHQRILMVGPFPPPVHGMAESNAAVLEMLRIAGGDPEVLNVAHTGLDRSLPDRLGRLPKVLSGMVRIALLRKTPGEAIYISVSGGLGQVYEIAILGIARLRRMRVYLHHRSFAYLYTPNRLTSVLTKAAGSTATHVALCPGMAQRLRDVYKAKNVLVASNALLVSSASGFGRRPRLNVRTIGFFSNISVEKGVFEFLDLAEQLEAQKLPIEAKLAGPFQDHKVEQAVRARMKGLPSVEYVGSKYGREKDRFLSAIDILIFPTLYPNEAEPRTILEAISQNIPVIAFGRGCIPEILNASCGEVIDMNGPFVPLALERILEWFHDPTGFHDASVAALRRFEELRRENKRLWDEFVNSVLFVD